MIDFMLNVIFIAIFLVALATVTGFIVVLVVIVRELLRRDD